MMSEQAKPERPPESGRGSSVEAWREYAAAVTDSPVESWSTLSRDEIVELLDTEGAEQPDQDGAPGEDAGIDEGGGGEQAGVDPDAAPASRRRGRPVWMVPTDDGPVPEPELLQAQRDEWRAKAVKARAAREAAASSGDGAGISSADVAALNPAQATE